VEHYNVGGKPEKIVTQNHHNQ